MTTLKVFAVALAAAAIMGLAAADALAQYYVPLRYDLRYTPNPGYIAPVPYASPPPRPDPYAFGSIQYGGLDLTGNVRAGKSFRAGVPFGQQGSQVSARLPSLALSNFRRDSIGIEDLGTGVEYGAALPYFPGSGSVTSLATAQARFAPPPLADRAPYALPNVNAALPGYTAVPAPGYLAGSAPPPLVAPSQVPTYRPGGLYVPRSAIEWVNALVEGRGAVPPVTAPVPTAATGSVEETPQQPQMDLRLGLPPPPLDPRIGIQAPGVEAGQPVPQAETGMPAAPTPQGAAAPAELFQSPLYWRLREAATTEKPARGAADAGAPAATLPPPPRSAADDAQTEPAWTGQPREPFQVPPAAAKLSTTPATYADYLARAEAAMKDGKYGAADALFEAATVMDADQPSAFFGRVNALLGDYRYLQASLVLDRGLRLHPDWARRIPQVKAAYHKPEVYDRIAGDLVEDIKNRPQSVEPNLLLGYLYLASGKPAEARSYLSQVALVRGERPGSERALLDAVNSIESPK